MSEVTLRLLNGDLFEKAYFLYLHALENSWRFLAEVHSKFKGFGAVIKGKNNTNLKRITEKIKEVKVEGELMTPFRITDMVGCSIGVETHSKLIEVYNILESKFNDSL